MQFRCRRKLSQGQLWVGDQQFFSGRQLVETRHMSFRVTMVTAEQGLCQKAATAFSKWWLAACSDKDTRENCLLKNKIWLAGAHETTRFLLLTSTNRAGTALVAL